MSDPRVPPFDQRQRYSVLASLYHACVGARDRAELSVLDVGGFFRDFGGRPALPARELTAAGRAIVVDREPWNRLESDDAFAGSDGYCRADAGRLPFCDGTFDIVSCLDVLEHVPRDRRPGVIREISRVCRGWLLIAVPFADDGSPARERLFADFIAATGQLEHQQLGEHIRFGLPTHAEMLGMLPAATRSFGYGNLDRWIVMMLAKHYLLALPYNLSTFHRLEKAYARDAASVERQAPFYRRFYLATIGSGIPDAPLARVEESFRAIEPTGSDRAPLGAGLVSRLLQELVEADADRLDEARAPVLEENAALRAEIVELRQAVAHLRSAVEEARAVLRAVEASRTYKLSRLLRRILPGGA